MLSAFSLSLLASSCGSIQYFYQATQGQLALLNHAKPISEAVHDEHIRPRIRELLADVEVIKKFGETQGLKPTPNYQEYVQLDRPAAVWVVSASEPLKFNSKVWSFPIVGSFPYLGWFDLKQAKQFAETLKQEGWDVDVRGARAYSTLGWFRDAVLSSMIPDGDEALGDLANVIIHESVHATLYIKGQSYFDESLANFIADQLTPVFLKQKSGENSPEFMAYLDSEKKSAEAEKTLHTAYLQLEDIYDSKASDDEKRVGKKKILDQLQSDLKWKRPINNATLIQYKTYNSGQDQFNALFDLCQKDVKRFLGTLKELNTDFFPKAQQEDLAPVFAPLLKAGCKAI